MRALVKAASSVTTRAATPKDFASAARSGPAYRMEAPAYPLCSCFTSMSDSAASLNTMTVIGRRSRAIVSSSEAIIMKPPSPVRQSTRRSG